MAEDIPLDKARPAEYVFAGHVQSKLAEIKAANPRARKVVQPAE